ncbi:hypothetical protein CPB83DRAFT_853827 [Crepidotus variabilis]|uniref:RRM domain-containing protein n=1 Tax=Crepidotus variabilis TaxID=179855 RepID=A0A9P6JPT1_9AGAR|nr:hypothetical protein CPB83DRAFT_853827 [Crepidotus variabilis]
MIGSLALRSSNALRVSRSVTGQIANVSARSLSSFAVSRTGLSANFARTSVSPSFNVLGMSLARSLSQTAPLNVGFQSQGNPPNSSIFVGNLPWSATQEELQELFAEFGEVQRIRIHTQSDGRPRGFAHVEFASKDAAVACFTSAAEEALFFGGRDLVIDYAKGDKVSVTPPNNRLYFTGMQAGESGLRQILGKHVDEVVTIYFLKDGHTGEPTETGFVEFKDIPTATEALEHLNAVPDAGERFNAAYARPQKARTDRNDRPRNPRMFDNKEGYSGRGFRSEGGNRERGGYGRQEGGNRERGGYGRQDGGRSEGRSYGRGGDQ